MKRMIVFTLLLLVSALSGCMTYDEGRVGTLGSSVYQTHYQQIADKQLAANPGTEVSPSGTDGPVTERVMDGYRGVTGDASQVGQPIQINIGN
jgi:major membrane immunogen (membrane-anchored lipoprotein)